ncbi:MAG: hypothetical protein LBL71_02765 [Endomicrobium sp.]|jgi:hypothetical protein|nr:hypothetical protein [Endomicrobium sp.]
MKKAVIVLAGILMMGSAEPARAVNIPDWAIAGIGGVITSVVGYVYACVCFNLLPRTKEIQVKAFLGTVPIIFVGSIYGSIKAAKYFGRKKEKEEEEEEEKVKRNWFGIRKKG